MKKQTGILLMSILISSCSFIDNKPKEAIKICQNSKVQFTSGNSYAYALNLYGLNDNATWLDYANIMAKESSNNRFDWQAKPTNEKEIYLVSFIDQEKWGLRWEVDIKQQIVKYINDNEYLCRKYGLTRFDEENSFEITDILTDTLKIGRTVYQPYDGIKYFIKASVINKTDKNITKASITGNLKVVFKDKTITGETDWECGFNSKISISKPWTPNTKREFYIETKGIEPIYKDYDPEYVYFEISLKAEDPVGFTFNKNIAEYDLINKWKNLRK